MSHLDAETVVVAPRPEVTSAIRDDVASALGTEEESASVFCKSISDWAKRRQTGNSPVQLSAELVLADIEGAERVMHAHGYAGFAGYPKGSCDQDVVAGLSMRMKVLMPEKGDHWGSGQFTSNALQVASMQQSRAQPHSKYCAPHRRNPDSCFLHFIGYARYTTSVHAHVAKRLAGGRARR